MLSTKTLPTRGISYEVKYPSPLCPTLTGPPGPCGSKGYPPQALDRSGVEGTPQGVPEASRIDALSAWTLLTDLG
ncbi:unnamed protein product [Arctogadus glacialis]